MLSTWQLFKPLNRCALPYYKGSEQIGDTIWGGESRGWNVACFLVLRCSVKFKIVSNDRSPNPATASFTGYVLSHKLKKVF